MFLAILFFFFFPYFVFDEVLDKNVSYHLKFRVNRKVRSIRATENFHWLILFPRFSIFQSILDILDSSICFLIRSTQILVNHVVHNTESGFQPWSMKYWKNGTNYLKRNTVSIRYFVPPLQTTYFIILIIKRTRKTSIHA